MRPGDVLDGKYRIERVLAVGGMGVIAAATHVHLGQKVALKFLLPGVLHVPGIVDRFLREARAAVRLRSEHVARVLDVGTAASGLPYTVFELLEGEDLSTLFARRGALPVAEAIDYVLQACAGLAEAHAAGIVHRDIKPANLFLVPRPDRRRLLKVLDFGISKVTTGNEAALTRTAGLMGSPAYMSPEQMRCARDVDARTDVWALGVILYQAVTGALPFDAATIPAVCLKAMMEPPAPLPRSPAELRDLEPVLLGALEKDVARRYGTVAEFADALAPFAPPHALPLLPVIRGTLGRATIERPVMRARRRRPLPFIAAAAAFALIGAAAALISGGAHGDAAAAAVALAPVGTAAADAAMANAAAAPRPSH